MGYIIFLCALAVFAAALLIIYLAVTKGEAASSGWLTKYKYAHRGLHDEVSPENSISAFEKAAEAGYAVELDVHLSNDGQLIVFHDDNLKRMTGLDKNVSELSIAELTQCRLLESSECIPLFSDVLKTLHSRVPVLVELKNTGSAGELEEKTWEALKNYQGKYAVQSFSPFSMRWFRFHAPEVLRGQLSSRFDDFNGNLPAYQIFSLKNLLSNVFARPNFISYDIGSLPKGVVARLRKRGLYILGWTVRNEAERAHAEKYCDTIIFEHIRP